MFQLQKVRVGTINASETSIDLKTLRDAMGGGSLRTLMNLLVISLIAAGQLPAWLIPNSGHIPLVLWLLCTRPGSLCRTMNHPANNAYLSVGWDFFSFF